MRILVTGATGFIGSAVVRQLLSRGHAVSYCVHNSSRARLPAGCESITVDYMNDLAAEIWLPRLRGIDAVINAVGILRETPTASFDALHHRAPHALFLACEQAGVHRVIQVSALGADPAAVSGYHRSKRAGDDALRTSQLDWTIVQPSLVFGDGGASTHLFLMLASLPVVPLVGRGDSEVQPIYIEDLATLIARLVETNQATRQTVPAVGPGRLTERDMLTTYRRALNFPFTFFLTVPMPLIRLAARFGDWSGHGALSTETLGMLRRGNTAPADVTTSLLGRPPRPIEDFIPPRMAAAARVYAVWSWLRPLLVTTVAIMWVSTGIASWFHGRTLGLDLLHGLGIPGMAATIAFTVACGLDVALGLVALARPSRWIWIAQLGAMVFYTMALTIVAPQLWTNPFGPLVKNLPIAVVLLGLAATER